MNRILLFIPMYNCEKQITKTLGQIDEEVSRYIAEVIVVDNQSPDNGVGTVKNFLRTEYRYGTDCPIRLLRNKDNYSLGGSHKVAFEYAINHGFDHVIVLHGDNQGDIHDIIPYLKNKRILQLDSFLGSRFEKDSRLINYSKFRIFGNHCFNILLCGLLRRHISDLGSGLNMYKVDYLKNRFYMNFANNLTFNVYMLIYGIYSDSDFRFFPLTWREEDQVSNAKIVKQSIEILRLVFGYLFHASKIFDSVANEYARIRYEYDELANTVGDMEE